MITARRRERGLCMHLHLCALIAALAFATATAQGQATEALLNEVTFQSASYADFRHLLSREAPAATVTVPATLGFPVEARDRYPAVVVVHTIGGYLDANEGQYAAELRKAGFATLTYDSLLRAERPGSRWPGPDQVCGRQGSRMLTPRCGCSPAIPGSTPAGSPLSASRMEVRWPTSQPLRGFVQRSIPDKPGSPRTSRIIRPGSLARSLNLGLIPDRPS
jgi:hypothetical protein